MKKTKQGFTLIELLVVISIVSLLSSIILASLQDARKKGRDTARIKGMTELRTALSLYFTDNGNYPLNTTDLVNGNYIKSINSDIRFSSWNNAVGGGPAGEARIVCNNTTTPCNTFHIGVLLEKSNSVLNSDKDWKLTGVPPAGAFDGISNLTNCGQTAPLFSVNNDLCYDLTQ